MSISAKLVNTRTGQLAVKRAQTLVAMDSPSGAVHALRVDAYLLQACAAVPVMKHFGEELTAAHCRINHIDLHLVHLIAAAQHEEQELAAMAKKERLINMGMLSVH